MRKLSFILCLILFSSEIIFAQESLSFSRVIRTDSVGKMTIYNSVNEWFASSYVSSKDVIQLSDKEAGIIIGNGTLDYNYGKAVYQCYNGFIKYSIKVSIKDNRYRVELINFTHLGNGTACSLGMITTAEIYAASGMSKSYENNVWNDLKTKTEEFSNKIFNSLENQTKTLEIDKVGSDW